MSFQIIDNIEVPASTSTRTRERGPFAQALDALEEAQAIAAEQPDFAPLDLFKMAPSIGAYYRGIDDEGLIEQMFQHACGTVVLIHEQVPEYRELPKRCFVHCYMDAMLLIKAVKLGKAEQVIDFLEAKGKIEAWQP